MGAGPRRRWWDAFPILSRARCGRGGGLWTALAAALSGPFVVAGEEVVLGVRVGHALCPADADDVAGLLDIAGTGTTAVRR